MKNISIVSLVSLLLLVPACGLKNRSCCPTRTSCCDTQPATPAPYAVEEGAVVVPVAAGQAVKVTTATEEFEEFDDIEQPKMSAKSTKSVTVVKPMSDKETLEDDLDDNEIK